jgi:hypothetical protein
MNADRLAKFQEEIAAKVNDEGAGMEDIAAIIKKYEQETGQKIVLEFKIQKLQINIDGKAQELALAGRCLKVPCPNGFPSCWVSC